MYIETKRLIIRSIEPADESAYIAMASDGSLDEDIFGENPGEYSQWIPKWLKFAMQADKADNPLKDSLAYTIVEKERGIPVGSVGCSYYEDLEQVGLVYFTGAEFRGNGYASEAAAAYAKYFLEHYDIPKISTTIKVQNSASCKVTENAGFTLLETKMYQDYLDSEPKLYRFYEMRKTSQD